MTTSYSKFIHMFKKLSPYDLKHFSECFLCNIEAGFEGSLCGAANKVTLTEKDIKFALTETMQEILLVLKQRDISIEHLKVDPSKARKLAESKLTA